MGGRINFFFREPRAVQKLERFDRYKHAGQINEKRIVVLVLPDIKWFFGEFFFFSPVWPAHKNWQPSSL